MSNVTMPRLSDTMQEGAISRWLKKPGDAVQKGDILAEIETDKANMELEAYEAGVLEEILVQEGETVPIGQAIAVIGSGSTTGAKKQAGQDANGQQKQQAVQPQQEQQKQQSPAPAQSSQEATGQGSKGEQDDQDGQGGQGDRKGRLYISAHEDDATAEESGENGLIKASPLARRMAEEHGLDLRKLQGSGPHGRIVRDDIEDFLEQQQNTPTPIAAAPTPQQVPAASTQASVPGDTEVTPLTRMQTIVARRLTESKQSIPHFYVSNEVDMTDALVLRQTFNASAGEGGVKVSVNDLVIKACALALETFPEVNSSIKGDQFLRYKHIHIGMAVDIPAGLVVPVIHDANIKGVRTIAREAKALIEKARANKLAPADLEGGTFSVSNLGMMDVTDFVAVINPPQAAILAIASTRKQFVPIDGQPVIRDLMPMTMSSDHRILYGATVARFLQEVKRLLQNPYTLLG